MTMPSIASAFAAEGWGVIAGAVATGVGSSLTARRGWGRAFTGEGVGREVGLGCGLGFGFTGAAGIVMSGIDGIAVWAPTATGDSAVAAVAANIMVLIIS